MTKQEKTFIAVKKTRETVDATPQSVVTEGKSKNNTALILSAVVIATTLAAGVDSYGWGKQQAINQTVANNVLTNQLMTLQKTQKSQKAELGNITRQQAVQLKRANRQ